MILASSAGAASRCDSGLVIASAMAIGILFTLFVLPAIYTMVVAQQVRQTEEEDGPMIAH